jgi:hypothetical protein
MNPNTEDLLNKWLDGSLTRQEAETLLQACKDPELQSALENWLFDQYDHADRAVYFSTAQKRIIYNKAIRPDAGRASASHTITGSLMQIPADPATDRHFRYRRFSSSKKQEKNDCKGSCINLHYRLSGIFVF